MQWLVSVDTEITIYRPKSWLLQLLDHTRVYSFNWCRLRLIDLKTSYQDSACNLLFGPAASWCSGEHCTWDHRWKDGCSSQGSCRCSHWGRFFAGQNCQGPDISHRYERFCWDECWIRELDQAQTGEELRSCKSFTERGYNRDWMRSPTIKESRKRVLKVRNSKNEANICLVTSFITLLLVQVAFGSSFVYLVWVVDLLFFDHLGNLVKSVEGWMGWAGMKCICGIASSLVKGASFRIEEIVKDCQQLACPLVLAALGRPCDLVMIHKIKCKLVYWYWSTELRSKQNLYSKNQ